MTGLHIGGKSCSDIAKIAAVDGDRLAVTSLMQQHVYLCGVQCYMLCISCYWDQSRVTSLEGVFERPSLMTMRLSEPLSSLSLY